MAYLFNEIADGSSRFDSTEINTSAIRSSALKKILPSIIKNSLTERQSECIRLKYFENLNQNEIAQRLSMSQPTVSRHLQRAQKILDDRLKYCAEAVNRANEIWSAYMQ